MDKGGSSSSSSSSSATASATLQPSPQWYYKPDDNYVALSTLFYYLLTIFFFFLFGFLRIYFKGSITFENIVPQSLGSQSSGSQGQQQQHVSLGSSFDKFVHSYCNPESSESNGNHLKRLLNIFIRPLKAFIFTAWNSVRISEKQIIEQCGLDAYLCLRLSKLCVILLSKYTIIGLFVLFPIYISQPQGYKCGKYCAAVDSRIITTVDDDAYSAKCLCNFVDRSSMAHIKAESNTLWIPAIAMALISIITLIDLRKEFVNTIRIRSEFWLSHPPQIHTIFVHGIPFRLQNAGRLRRYFDRLFPGKVLKVEMLCDMSDIQSVGDRRHLALMSLERAMAMEERGVTSYLWQIIRDSSSRDDEIDDGSLSQLLPEKNNHTVNNNNGDDTKQNDNIAGKRQAQKSCYDSILNSVGIKRVNAVAYYKKELERLNLEFSSLRKKYDDEIVTDTIWRSRALDFNSSRELDSALTFDIIDDLASPAASPISNRNNLNPSIMAFVTFSQVTPATIAAQSVLNVDADLLEVKPAPEPRDVLWRNLYDQGTRYYFLRRLISRFIFLLILVFWGALTSFVGAVTSVEALSKKIPDLNTYLLTHPSAASWLNRAVTLIYVILLALVLPIIGFLVKLEFRVSESSIVRATGERYFVFLVVQLFLFYTIAGTLFKTLVTIIDRPSNIISTLASTLPKNAAFYIDFITVKTFWSTIELIRTSDFILGLLRFWPLGYYGTLTDRERKTTICGCNDFYYPGPASLHTISANVLLIFFIATTYAVLQPWLLPPAVIFMAVMHFTCCVQFKYQTRQLFDGEGVAWAHHYWAIISALITAQLTLVGTLLIKSGFFQAFFVFLVMMVFAIASLRIQDEYRGHASAMPIEIAAELDDPGSINMRRDYKLSQQDVSAATVQEGDIVIDSREDNASESPSKSRSRTSSPSFTQTHVLPPFLGVAKEVGSELRLYEKQVYKKPITFMNTRAGHVESSISVPQELEDIQRELVDKIEQKKDVSNQIPHVFQYINPVLAEEREVFPSAAVRNSSAVTGVSYGSI